VPERIGPGLVEEFGQISHQFLVPACDHCVELRAVHAHYFLERVDLDLLLAEVSHRIDQTRLVEFDLKLVAVAFRIQTVVNDRFEQAAAVERIVVFGRLCTHCKHLLELESVQYNCTHHFGFRECGRLVVALDFESVLLVQGVDERLEYLLADFSAVVGFHPQKTIGTDTPVPA